MLPSNDRSKRRETFKQSMWQKFFQLLGYAAFIGFAIFCAMFGVSKLDF